MNKLLIFAFDGTHTDIEKSMAAGAEYKISSCQELMPLV